MAVAPSYTLVDEITDFLMTNPKPDEIVAFQLSEQVSQRALKLLERNRQNQLTPEERLEMEMYMGMDHFMTVMKAKARLKFVS